MNSGRTRATLVGTVTCAATYQPLATPSFRGELPAPQLRREDHQRVQSSTFQLSSRARVMANPSLERTSTGKALGPRSGVVHHPPGRPSALPAAAAQLKR